MSTVNEYTIQILKSEHITGVSSNGRKYDFYRHSCLILDKSGAVVEMGDMTTDNELSPGRYPAGFEVGSYQGKLTARLIIQPSTSAMTAK